jgi:hypothetical protein
MTGFHISHHLTEQVNSQILSLPAANGLVLALTMRATRRTLTM